MEKNNTKSDAFLQTINKQSKKEISGATLSVLNYIQLKVYLPWSKSSVGISNHPCLVLNQKHFSFKSGYVMGQHIFANKYAPI